MKIRNLNSWEEFKDALDVLKHDCQNDEFVPLFRGQENSKWSLSTTLDRQREGMSFVDYYQIIHRIKPQVESFTSRDWPIPEFMSMLKETSDYDRFFNHLWAGLPTWRTYVITDFPRRS